MLRAGGLALAALAVAAVGVGVGISGARGAFGALVGVVLVGVFFSASLLVAAGAMRWLTNDVLVPVVLVAYVVKVAALGALAFALADVSALDGGVLAGTVVAGTLLWSAAQIRLVAAGQSTPAARDSHGRGD